MLKKPVSAASVAARFKCLITIITEGHAKSSPLITTSVIMDPQLVFVVVVKMVIG
jgi:hypothetical protein